MQYTKVISQLLTCITKIWKLVTGSDLKASIEKTLYLLCEEKEKLSSENKGNLIVKTYDYLDSHSIMLIDQDSPANAWIKVENRPIGSEADSRPSDVAFRMDDEDFLLDH